MDNKCKQWSQLTLRHRNWFWMFVFIDWQLLSTKLVKHLSLLSYTMQPHDFQHNCCLRIFQHIFRRQVFKLLLSSTVFLCIFYYTYSKISRRISSHCHKSATPCIKISELKLSVQAQLPTSREHPFPRIHNYRLSDYPLPFQPLPQLILPLGLV